MDSLWSASGTSAYEETQIHVYTCFLDPFWLWMSTYCNDWDLFAFCLIWATKCATESSSPKQLHLLGKIIASMNDRFFLRICYFKRKTNVQWLGVYSFLYLMYAVTILCQNQGNGIPCWTMGKSGYLLSQHYTH